jgi:hypothetical protein
MTNIIYDDDNVPPKMSEPRQESFFDRYKYFLIGAISVPIFFLILAIAYSVLAVAPIVIVLLTVYVMILVFIRFSASC